MRLHLVLAPMLVLAACSGSSVDAPAGAKPGGAPRAPAAVGALPDAGAMAPLHLYVSNQSFAVDPVDVDVFVDGVKLVTGDFLVGNQHTFVRFDFQAATTKHTLRAVTQKGGVERTEPVDVPASGRWVVVMFWSDGQAAPSFTVDALDAEPQFR